MSTQIVRIGAGKCSCFGGSDDGGMAPDEGLALVRNTDLLGDDAWFSRNFNFLRMQQGAIGGALDPKALYCAMRFAYSPDGDVLPGLSKDQVRRVIFAVSAKGRTIFVQALDWGPNVRTGRLIDLSPGALAYLGVNTDDEVTVEAVLPAEVAS